MRILGSKILVGESGEEYSFNVYPADMRFNDFIPGVYLISREQEPGQDDATENYIYLGESNNVDVDLQQHDQQDCFDQQQYNRISLFKNASRDVRNRILADLLPVLTPGCNRS